MRKFAGLAFAPATVQSADTAGQPPGEGSKVSDDKQAIVNLTDEQLTEARIDLAQAESGILAHRIIVPGTIIPVADRIARVAVKLSGTVAELRKNIGDSVIKGECSPSSKAVKSRTPKANTSPPASPMSCSRHYFSATERCGRVAQPPNNSFSGPET
nr:hypothetical protein [Bradyrhizobium sp. 144]